ncbi:MAG: hypothetical protein ACMXYK_03505 [Candidatus Woesearchaeota archaeon]
MRQHAKKAGLDMAHLAYIIVGIVSFVVAVVIIQNFFTGVSTSAEHQVCEWHVGTFNEIISNDNSWQVLDAAVSEGLKHPLCKSVHKEIDLRSYNNEDIPRQVALALGDMVATCWKTFGEGRYVNTFGQGSRRYLVLRDKKNYFVECYTVSFIFPRDVTVLVSDIAGASPDNIGYLWRYNTRGNRITVSEEDMLMEYISGNTHALSYMAYVYYNNGYIEFLENVREEATFDAVDRVVYHTIAGATIGGTGGTFVAPGLGSAIGAIAGGAVGASGAIAANIIEGFTRIVPLSGDPMERLYPHTVYSVRYYSPYVADPSAYNDYTLNNIKIVPVGAESVGTRLGQ